MSLREVYISVGGSGSPAGVQETVRAYIKVVYMSENSSNHNGNHVTIALILSCAFCLINIRFYLRNDHRK